MPTNGDVLAGRYRLIELLGRGGMGSVWKAEHVELGSEVAIKLIDEAIARRTDILSRFRREAKSAASLKSRYVVQIFDYGVDNDTPYIAMELLHGESLGARIDREGRISEETATIMSHVGRAIGKAHELGIVHRDLKPDNIFLVQAEDEEYAKVLDFGIAKAINPDPGETNASGLTHSGTLLGSPGYMSPEQARSKPVGPGSDLWSLGIITFECLVGERPFQADAFGDLLLMICTSPHPKASEIASVPAGFDDWFEKACARDVAERFTNVKEMVEALRQVLLGPEVAPATVWRGSIPVPPMPVGVATNGSVGGVAPLLAPALPAAPAETVGTAGGVTRTADPLIEIKQVTAPEPGNRKTLVAAGVGVAAVGLIAGAFFFSSRSSSTPAVPEVSADIEQSVIDPVPSMASSQPEIVVDPDTSTAVPTDSAVKPGVDATTSRGGIKPVRPPKPRGSTPKPGKTTTAAPAPTPSERYYGF